MASSMVFRRKEPFCYSYMQINRSIKEKSATFFNTHRVSLWYSQTWGVAGQNWIKVLPPTRGGSGQDRSARIQCIAREDLGARGRLPPLFIVAHFYTRICTNMHKFAVLNWRKKPDVVHLLLEMLCLHYFESRCWCASFVPRGYVESIFMQA